MTRPTDARLRELGEIAGRATSGPWTWERAETKEGTLYQHVLAVGMENPSMGRGICATFHSDAIGPVIFGNGYEMLPPRLGKHEDAAHISAFNPLTAQALVQEIIQLRKAVEVAREFIAWTAPMGLYDATTEPTRDAIGEYARKTLASIEEMTK